MSHYVDLPRLEQGYRCCTYCSALSIPPDAAAFRTMCGGCYAKLKTMDYDVQYKKGCCTDCRAEIEPDVLELCRRIGRRLTRCRSCRTDAIAEVTSSRRVKLMADLRASVPTA